MSGPIFSGNLQQTTNYRVVLPFYIYGAVSFLIACVLLLFNTDLVHLHYYSPHTLAIVHTMALAWGTMIILGASHQLLPVLIEGKLDNDNIAYATFAFTAIGIPVLIVGFFNFNYNLLEIGATLVNAGVLLYLINVFRSSFKSNTRGVHAWYMMTASIWLFSTTFFGLLLVFNFSYPLLPEGSVHYLSIHAHLGIIGWFLMLVIGVGTRLIPMFFISKYTNEKVLWVIYWLINSSLISFILIRLLNSDTIAYYFPLILALSGVVLFVRHIIKAHAVRIRRKVDEQMKTSIISVFQMLLPIVALLIALLFLPIDRNANLGLIYGFCVFFGWITAIILGMTFKTLPFIVWNREYHKKARSGKTPAPKELFNEKAYNTMLILYLAGFVTFIVALSIKNSLTAQIATVALLIAACLYVYNVGLTIFHKAN
ncbi:MAG: hypothetical protein M9916_05765 [Crocinitomicaceae bacterium]|nr:hypothetical protein [Crocinitomicaceae bacterium]